MKKTELIKPGSERHELLHKLAREINSREDAISKLKEKFTRAGSEFLSEVLIQGQALLQTKSALPHGLWLEWLKANCPLVSIRSAQVYMRLASNTQRAAYFGQVDSLREALLLCAMNKTENSGADKKHESKTWPPYLEALGKVSKFVGYVERFPVHDWPDEGKDKLRQDLEPVARELWPERFGGE